MSRLMILLLTLLAVGPARAAVPAAPVDNAPTILVFGDSLSAGYGIDPARGWVSLLAPRLKSAAFDYRIVNASVSGETTAGGLARLPRALQTLHPALVVLELGGNDGLRALPLASMRENLDRMIRLCRDMKLPVLLIGIRMPANYGPRFTSEFANIYTTLARQYALPFVPFLLAGVAEKPELMQGDGIHPNEQGQPLVLDNVWPALSKLLSAGKQVRKKAA